MARQRRIFKQDEYRETGFGNRVMEDGQRLMNKDGRSNVQRTGLPFYKSTNLYHELITMSWIKFFIIVISLYTAFTIFFAILYYLVDASHISGMVYNSEAEKFLEICFFSAQSLTTVGYGRLNPSGVFDSSVAAVESMIGLLGFALATGLLYGRFSRPVARVLFSQKGIVAPYKGFTAFMIRVANKNRSELIEPEASMIMSYILEENGNKVRKFANLKLELTHVTLLTMSWTIVHPVDEESPMYGWTEEDFGKNNVEILILLKAYEETFAQTVHARSSYRPAEIVFGAKFLPMTSPGENNSVIVDLRKVGAHEPAPLFEQIQV